MIYSKSVTIAATIIALAGLFRLAYEPDTEAVAETPAGSPTEPATIVQPQEYAPPRLPTTETIPQAAPLVTQENTRYLFDLDRHTPAEIAALLKTAEEKMSIARAQAQDIQIAIVLHGPDIRVFTKSNYSTHGDIVDTAARLDAYGVIDFMVCEFSARQQGITRGDLPSFIDFVPFGPAEIDSLESQGYLRL